MCQCVTIIYITVLLRRVCPVESMFIGIASDIRAGFFIGGGRWISNLKLYKLSSKKNLNE